MIKLLYLQQTSTFYFPIYFEQKDLKIFWDLKILSKKLTVWAWNTLFIKNQNHTIVQNQCKKIRKVSQIGGILTKKQKMQSSEFDQYFNKFPNLRNHFKGLIAFNFLLNFNLLYKAVVLLLKIIKIKMQSFSFSF